MIVTRSGPTLCNPMDGSPPGYHEILQARILEWVGIPFSRGSPLPRDLTQVPAMKADSLPSEPAGKLIYLLSLANSLQLHGHNKPGSSVLHYLPKFVQIHVHWVGGDAIQDLLLLYLWCFLILLSLPSFVFNWFFCIIPFWFASHFFFCIF